MEPDTVPVTVLYQGDKAILADTDFFRNDTAVLFPDTLQHRIDIQTGISNQPTEFFSALIVFSSFFRFISD